MTLFWNIFTKVAWAILSLRYKIEVKGLDQLSASSLPKKGGILFLPNHPALADPIFLFALLWPKFRIRPIVTERIYRIPFMKPWMKLYDAKPMPDLSASINQLKVKKAKEAIQSVVDGLHQKANFIFYPSGKLKVGPKEIVSGSSGAHDIVQQSSDVNIVLIRTSGLWGSSFSKAISGTSPDLFKTMFQGIKTILKNGIFFAPRRKITIEIEIEPKDFPRNVSRVEFNHFLENWYNRYKDTNGNICVEEPLQLVSYTFWKKSLPQITAQEKKAFCSEGIPISSETESKISKEIRRLLNSPNLEIKPEMSLTVDLGMDSLNIAEMIAFLSQKFDVEEVHPEDLETVQDLLAIAEEAKTIKRTSKQIGNARFSEEVGRPDPLFPSDSTIPEAFLNTCHRMGNFIACGDDLVGTMTYKKFKKSVLVLASHFKKFPESHVAVLLPASAGAYLVIMALLFAKKVPVMLNWTLGPRYLEEMMRISGAKKAISSWRFLDRLSHVEFGSVCDQLDLLEDIRGDLGLCTKLKGLFLSFAPKSFVRRALNLHTLTGNEDAVILFTSGTEAVPKGVPLTHKNILSNQKSLMECIDIFASDVIYSILPPFHSFGFSLTGILPFLHGLKVAYYPDPTDSFALAEGVARWKITFFCGAPNFLKGLFFAAKPEQISSVRLFISGAEKAPQELYDYVEKLKSGATLMEGYGITECAPVLSMNRLHLPPKGVGHPLPNVDVCTIHLETSELLPKGQEGEICVHGPNVFNGYLGSPRNPFIELQGEKWYRTGDIGYLDPEGRLILSGRIKRFTKLGGEMISLGAIEEVLREDLAKQEQKTTDTPTIAVCADEREGRKPEIIVFTTSNLINKERANEILNNAGFSRLIKVSQVRQITEIPILGTGKTNYRHLQTLIE